jgi:small subunit ribosomal protein S25
MATLPKPSSLSKVLAQLTREPQVKLPNLPHNGIKRLKLTFAKRNAHYGARHFLNEELPRLAYNNPSVEIQVERKEHLKTEPWTPELLVEFSM